MNAGVGPAIIDVEGPVLGSADRARLRHPAAGGVILFSRNYREPAQLRALVGEIRALRRELLLCVDHEGGRVQRFRAGFTPLPAMRRVGVLWDRDREAARAAARAVGVVIAAELAEFDVDFSFAPVLDLDYAEDSNAGTDMNFVMDDAGGFIEIQGTAETKAFSLEEMLAMMKLAQAGIRELIAHQKRALGITIT